VPGPAAPRSWLGPRVPVPSWSHSNCMMVPAGSAVPDVGWKSVPAAVAVPVGGCAAAELGAIPTAGPILTHNSTPLAFCRDHPAQHHQKEHLTANKPFFFPLWLFQLVYRLHRASRAVIA